jgi:hypothetical protein
MFGMSLPLTRPGRIWLTVIIALAGVLTALVLPPLKQAPAYHQFADQRVWLGIPNALNVLSNVGFLLVGAAGLSLLWSRSPSAANRTSLEPPERIAYTAFFAGLIFTGFGSAYYHWKPDDETLVWDRLPMTTVFMSLLAATIAERIDHRAGQGLLGPLLVAGAASVGYWRWCGNLWPYAVAQYYSMLVLGLIILLFPPRYNRSADLLVVAGLYALAKGAEALDGSVLAATRLVSGHTMKHLIAALAVYWVLRMLVNRARIDPTGTTSLGV